MTAPLPESSHYYVYLCRIGSVMRYVGKGSGYRKNRHKKASHNPELRAMIADANENGVPVRFRVLKSDLSERDALNLEQKCIDKWRRTLCNRNAARRAWEWEQRAEQDALEAAEGNAMLGYHDEHLEALLGAFLVLANLLLQPIDHFLQTRNWSKQGQE